MGNLEALGDAVTGGVLGRAVEPKAGESSDGHTLEANCLNCGAPLAGPYCAGLRPACPRPQDARRLLPRFSARRVALRRQDLADLADSRVEAGRADPALHRRPARALRLADRALPVLGFPDVRGAERDREVNPHVGSDRDLAAAEKAQWKDRQPSEEARRSNRRRQRHQAHRRGDPGGSKISR